MPKNTRLALWIVAFGMAILGMMTLSIIGAVIYSAISYTKPPEILGNWGGLIIGFFIGSFFNFAKDVLGSQTQNNTDVSVNKKGEI